MLRFGCKIYFASANTFYFHHSNTDSSCFALLLIKVQINQNHTPEDDIDLINIEGGALVSQYIYDALLAIVNDNQQLYFIN